MKNILISSGALLAFLGVLTRSLSSHPIQQFLLDRGKLDNFNLAADYLILHGLTIIVTVILDHLFPDMKFHRAAYLLIIGSILFQGTVLIKSCVSIQPFGFITPLGGLILMVGWMYLIIMPLFSVFSQAKTH